MKALAALGRVRPMKAICSLPRLSVSRVASARIPTMRALSTASTPSEAPAAVSAEAGTSAHPPLSPLLHLSVLIVVVG
jgi:hypothetical protein